MGRPSKVTVEVDGPHDDISMVRVSGDVVLVMEGAFSWHP
jgi:predicted PhzF superfamily epimerase YddE/YHI9